MKDLFVELTRLHNGHGIAASLAITLRDEMLRDSPRQRNTESLLADALLAIADEARQLSADVRTNRVGLSFVEGDQASQKPARRKKA